jgi:hypothetical protein
MLFDHIISAKAATGAVLVFAVLFYQVRNKFLARNNKKRLEAAAVEPKE